MSEYLFDVGADEKFIQNLVNCNIKSYMKVDLNALSKQIIDDLHDSINENTNQKASVGIIIKELLHTKLLCDNILNEKDKIQNSLLVRIFIDFFLKQSF